MTEAVTNPSGGMLADLPEYPMPRAAGCPFDPPPALRALQAEAPVTKVRLWDGSAPWLVTRYADQRALLADGGSALTTGVPATRTAAPVCGSDGSGRGHS